MKKFNKIMLLGLLSIFSSANVHAVGEEAEGAELKCEGKINLPETPEQEDLTLDGKFYAIPNPAIYSFGYFDARKGAKYISLGKTDKQDAIVINFTANDIADAMEIEKALKQISKNDLLIIFKEEGFTDFTPEEKSKIATVYACWLIQFNGVIADAAIEAANKKMTDVKANEEIVKNYYTMFTPTPTKSWSKKKIAAALVLGTATVAGLAIAAGNYAHDNNMCPAAMAVPCDYADKAVAIAYGTAAAAASALATALATQCDKLKQWLDQNRQQQEESRILGTPENYKATYQVCLPEDKPSSKFFAAWSALTSTAKSAYKQAKTIAGSVVDQTPTMAKKTATSAYKQAKTIVGSVVDQTPTMAKKTATAAYKQAAEITTSAGSTLWSAAKSTATWGANAAYQAGKNLWQSRESCIDLDEVVPRDEI